MTPGQQAREKIEAALIACGWVIQDFKARAHLIVVPDQIRTVVEAFKSALETELFPGRDMVPKTLIFAKDDSHAEDIVHIVREVFGEGNDFAKKITYQSKNPENVSRLTPHRKRAVGYSEF